MAYLGNNLDSDIQVNKYEYIATAGQDTFACTYDRAVDVYVNGMKLDSNDFTATNGTSITTTSPLNAGDVVDINAYFDVTYANFYTQAEADARFMDINEETLPAQTGHAGKFLTTNGGVASWGTVDLTDLNPSELTLPIYTSDPASPSAGDIYFNSTEEIVKSYDGMQWVQLSNKFAATGGTVSSDGTYKYHTFTSSGTFTADASGTVDILIAAGGAGGGYDVGGGGGAGGLVYASSVTLGSGAYSVVVGAGGAGSNNISSGVSQHQNGSNSSFPNQTAAIGGGRGGPYSASANSGGSGGGGGGMNGAGASGTTGQGYAGSNGQGSTSPYSAGGGGGAGGAASGYNTNGGGHGGVGANYSSWASATNTGESGYYCGGGGGGGGYNGGSGGGGTGGTGGGGNGHQRSSTTPAESGQANTGGGGGGTGSWSTSGPATGNGGSGIVIIRYLS